MQHVIKFEGLRVSTWIPLTHRSAFEGAWSFDLEAMRGHGMGLNTSWSLNNRAGGTIEGKAGKAWIANLGGRSVLRHGYFQLCFFYYMPCLWWIQNISLRDWDTTKECEGVLCFPCMDGSTEKFIGMLDDPIFRPNSDEIEGENMCIEGWYWRFPSSFCQCTK